LKIVLASGNLHKLSEFKALALSTKTELSLESAKAFGGMPSVIEDQGTFIGNGLKKARALRSLVPAPYWILADDSGLCVDYLGGLPGVESAYYAGLSGDAKANLEKLVSVMASVPEGKRGAYFICVLILISPDGLEYTFEGKTEGYLLHEPKGGEGFGYDPLFVPLGYTHTFAQLTEDQKNKISHRAKAWTECAAFLGR